MKARGEYRLLHTVNGCTHFARVVVSSRAVPPPDVFDDWLDAVRQGISDVLFVTGRDDQFWIESFVGTAVDTTVPGAWVAGGC